MTVSLLSTLTFLLVSTGFAFVSRKSLTRPGSHGFPRFLAWEIILVLFLLNYPHWVEEPFSPRQWLSWSCLLFSIYLVVHGTHLLRTLGKPDRQRHDDDLLDFEKTSRLVTVGIYRYIRHPLYSSLLFLAWGIFLKHISPLSLLLVSMASLFVYLTARQDEAECLQYFGDAYVRYRQTTRRFIPFVY